MITPPNFRHTHIKKLFNNLVTQLTLALKGLISRTQRKCFFKQIKVTMQKNYRTFNVAFLCSFFVPSSMAYFILLLTQLLIQVADNRDRVAKKSLRKDREYNINNYAVLATSLVTFMVSPCNTQLLSQFIVLVSFFRFKLIQGRSLHINITRRPDNFPGGGTPGNSWWGCAAQFSQS